MVPFWNAGRRDGTPADTVGKGYGSHRFHISKIFCILATCLNDDECNPDVAPIVPSHIEFVEL